MMSMNRKVYFLSLLVVVIVVLGGAALVTMSGDHNDKSSTVKDAQKDSETSDKPSTQAEPQEPEQSPVAGAIKGSYAGYSEQAFTEASSQTRILFFHAPWCPQCRALDESIKQQELPDNTVIFKVDYDTNQNLRQKYGVTLQTTLVRVDDKGEKVKSVVAYNNPTYSAVKGELGL